MTEIIVSPEDPDSPEARWCLGQYYGELASRFDGGFDPGVKAYAGNDEARPPAGLFVIARLDGRPAGCGSFFRRDGSTGEIKRMWVAPDARGMGMARRILGALEAAARAAGVAAIRLDTNASLKEAQALYRKAGYTEIARFNDNPYAHHWFEKKL